MRGLAKAGVAGIALALAVWLIRRVSAPGPAAAPEPTPAPTPAPTEPAAPAADAAPAVEGYCVRERKKVAIADAEPTTSKNGRAAVRGTCPDCGAKIFRFV
jgi:hypothetical protein